MFLLTLKIQAPLIRLWTDALDEKCLGVTTILLPELSDIMLVIFAASDMLLIKCYNCIFFVFELLLPNEAV